jgi:hypothetical protein
MPLTDSQWADEVADIFARLAAGTITEAEAASELGAATADWPTRSLSNAGLAEQLSRFKARVNGLILTDGPPANDLGGVNAIAIDLGARVLYGPKVVSTEWPDGVPFAEGPPGQSIELGVSATHIQWRVEGEDDWIDLYPLADLAGADGQEVSLRTSGGYVQWRLGAGGWANLVALSALTGDDGREIELGASETHIQWRYVRASDWTDLISLSAITPDAIPGPAAWIPVYANVADGARRVQQVADWFGGDGVKPATGQYLGPSGFVATAAEATDIRGAGGSGSGDMLAANNLSDLTDKASARMTLSVYSKAETDAALSGKATPAQITAAIDALLDSAPGALDTLNELAAALGDDPNFAATVTSALAARLQAATTAQVRTGTATDVGVTPAALAAAEGWVDLGNVSGTVTLDCKAGNKFRMVATGAITFADPTNKYDGWSGLISVRQDATGSRVMAMNAAIRKSGSVPVLSTAANAEDQFTAAVQGATAYFYPLLKDFKP